MSMLGLRWFSTARPLENNVKKLVDLINSKKTVAPKEWRKNDKVPAWKKQKLAIEEKHQGERWNPSKKLSRETMDSIRLLKNQYPHMTAAQLGEQYKVSAEVIRRILKSKWKPSVQEEESIHQRWKRRGERVKKYMNGDKTEATQKVIVIGTTRGGNDMKVQFVKDRKYRK